MRMVEGMKTKIISLLARLTSVRAGRQLTSVLACCSALGLLASCATGPETHTVSAPPPPTPTRSVTTTTTTTTPDTMPAGVVVSPANVTVMTTTPGVNGTIVTTTAPPAFPSEVVLAQPTSSHVWLAGYWTWRDSRYQWMPGHWEIPPTAAATWVAPTWHQQGNAYKFTEGYWN